MYEFKPRKKERIAPVWFILVALLFLLIGANITFYFVSKANKNDQNSAATTATSTPTLIIIKTPTATVTQSGSTTKTASPSGTITP